MIDTVANSGNTGAAEAATVLEISSLSVRYATPDGVLAAVNDFSLQLRAGECVGVVGESGAGKSQSFLAVMGLLASNATVAGSAKLGARELVGASIDSLNQVRGSQLAMIFQDPMTSLTPHIKVGHQIAESIMLHEGLSREAAMARALKLLETVQVTDAAIPA
jgi:oligopeptide transport system ATP-binding protein